MATLTRGAALERFAAARRAVLGTVDPSGRPHLVPVTFALMDAGKVDSEIAFAVDHKPKTTTLLRRLANIEHNPEVSFLVDEYSDDWGRLWWVRVDGVAEMLTEGARYEKAIDSLADRYRQYRVRRPSGAVVLTTVNSVSGWTSLDISSGM